MPKAKKAAVPATVDEYMQALTHPLKDAVAALRKIILAADNNIAEQVKWNSPAFYYTGAMKDFDPKTYKRDIVVLNLHRPDHVLLVFPTGAVIKDVTGLLQGNFTDGRKIIKYSSLEDVLAKEKELQTVIQLWLQQVDQ